jgi:hypothetical protein
LHQNGHYLQTSRRSRPTYQRTIASEALHYADYCRNDAPNLPLVVEIGADENDLHSFDVPSRLCVESADSRENDLRFEVPSVVAPVLLLVVEIGEKYLSLLDVPSLVLVVTSAENDLCSGVPSLRLGPAFGIGLQYHQRHRRRHCHHIQERDY